MFRIIFTRPTDGGLSIIVPAEGVTEEEAAAIIPTGVTYEVLDESEIPSNRTFRNAWKKSGRVVDTDLLEAREIANEHRRNLRDKAFEPWDRLATVPQQAQAAEAARVVIRNRDSGLQTAIEAAEDVDALLAVYETITFEGL
jgi:hypothetical protein